MKYILTIITITMCFSALISQYNYGIEICNQDLRVEGKIDIDDGNNNIHIGRNAGIADQADGNVFIGPGAGLNSFSGSSNVFIGANSALDNITGFSNTFLGTSSGSRNISGRSNLYLGESAATRNNGSFNIILGTEAGVPSDLSNTEYNQNIYIGYKAGGNNTGSGNVFIGHLAGLNSSGSNLLYIENSEIEEPLILGDFENNTLKINGSVHISEFAEIAPRANEPFTCDSTREGFVYYNSTDHTLKVCNGTEWMSMNQ